MKNIFIIILLFMSILNAQEATEEFCKKHFIGAGQAITKAMMYAEKDMRFDAKFELDKMNRHAIEFLTVCEKDVTKKNLEYIQDLYDNYNTYRLIIKHHPKLTDTN